MKKVVFQIEESVVEADELTEHDLVICNDDVEREYGILGVNAKKYVFWAPYTESVIHQSEEGETLLDFLKAVHKSDANVELLYFSSGRELVDWLIERG